MVGLAIGLALQRVHHRDRGGVHAPRPARLVAGLPLGRGDRRPRARAARSRDAGDPRGRDGGHHRGASPGRRCGRRAGRASLRSSSRALAGTGSAPASPACTRRRWGATRSSRRTRATAPSARRCACSPGASRPSRRTSTSGSRPARRGQAPEPAARAPAAPARPVGQLPVLAGQGHGLRVDPHHRLRRLPAHRRGARVSRLRRLGRAGRRAAALGRHRGPSLLWWDARLQPRYGTVEVRIMDAQTTVADVGAVAALVQSLALLELERPDDAGDGPPANELIEENRFLAARDGMRALLIDVASGAAHRRRRSARRRPRRLPPLGRRARLRARAGGGPSPRGGQRRLAPGRARARRRPASRHRGPRPRLRGRCADARPTRASARPGGRPSVRPHPSGRRRRRARRPSRMRHR